MKIDNFKNCVIMELDVYDYQFKNFIKTQVERNELKEKLDSIRYIFEIWNYNLPDEAIKELKEILNDE